MPYTPRIQPLPAAPPLPTTTKTAAPPLPTTTKTAAPPLPTTTKTAAPPLPTTKTAAMSAMPFNRKQSGFSYEELAEYKSFYCCFICIDNFTNPKALDCKHVFCESCLQLYYRIYRNIQYEPHGIFAPCPTCKKLTRIPPDGLAGLAQEVAGGWGPQEKLRKVSHASDGVQRCEVCYFKEDRQSADEAVYYCSKCIMNFCESCRLTHDQQALFKSHPVIHIYNKEVLNLYCDSHNKLPAKYFCIDCKLPICTVCVLDLHRSHHSVHLRDALALRRDNLRTLLNSLGPKLDRLEAKAKRLSHYQIMHSKHRNGLHGDATDVQPPQGGAQRRSLIENGHLIHSLSFPETSEPPETPSPQPMKSIYYHLQRLNKLFEMSTKILEMSHSKKLLLIYDDIVARIQNVLDHEVRDLQNDIEGRLGKVMETTHELAGRMTPPSKTTSLSSLTESRANANSDDSSVDDPLFFDPRPQSLLVKPKLVWKQEKQRSDISELYNPCDVAFLPDGRLIVAEYDVVNDKNNRLCVFDQQGEVKDVIAQGDIRPLGLAVTKDGNIVVADCKGKRVKIYSPSGQLLSELGKGQFGWPYGVAVNSKGHLIVSDAFNDSISVYQTDGKRLRQFGSSGPNTAQFKNPYHVACDAQDNIIVSDSGNNCIKVFDASGKFKFKTTDVRRQSSASSMSDFVVDARKGHRRRLKAPRGVTLDFKGNMLVADDYSRVCLFDGTGRYVRNILTEEDGVRYPEAVACSDQGQLAVTEYNANNMFSIKVFKMYE